jgi:RNA polymerase sigma factor (sigma-70 family)
VLLTGDPALAADLAHDAFVRVAAKLETLRDALWAALQGLPARQRIAIVLRYYEGASERDIADALHCAPGTVKSLVSCGLARLREVVEDV